MTARIGESSNFVPATVAEYCGFAVNFAELVDLGGANAVGMVWRAAAAIELGLANVVVCAIPARPTPRAPARAATRSAAGSSALRRPTYGSPQAEFDIPYGHLAQNAGYCDDRAALQRGARLRRPRDGEARGRSAHECLRPIPTPIFHGQPLTIDDVLASKMSPTRSDLLEIVMPVAGGHALVVAKRERAKRTPPSAGLRTRLRRAAGDQDADLRARPARDARRSRRESAFSMAGVGRDEIDLACLYDCYTITVLLTLEDAGFCKKGQGLDFVRDHDLTCPGRLSAQHPRRPALLRPGGRRGRHVAGERSRPPDPTRGRRSSAPRLRDGLRLGNGRRHERAISADPAR